MHMTPKQSAWQRTIATYRKQHPKTPNALVFKRASKLYRSKTPSRSVKRTPARRPSKVCARYSSTTPRRCQKFRKTPKRHCSKFSTPKGKPKRCIRYSRTPLRR